MRPLLPRRSGILFASLVLGLGACPGGQSGEEPPTQISPCLLGQVDFENDPDNCKECGQACSPLNVQTRTCTAGRCSGVCRAGFADCNNDKLIDGCETDTSSDPDNCGACHRQCVAPLGEAPRCVRGVCAGPTCATNLADCDGLPQNGCEIDLRTNRNHCGKCYNACSNAEGCCGGRCIGTSTDPSNCGACGNKCPLGSSCCGGRCVDPASDKGNCGACGRICSVTQTCCSGQCVDLNTDAANCGVCGRGCSGNHAAPRCDRGACVSPCDSGFGDCDGNLQVNGCETDTRFNINHCGRCGGACSPNHATPSCANGNCVSACTTGFGNCDGDVRTNGCETDLRADMRNCGACNRACGASQQCFTGACIQTCTRVGWKTGNMNWSCPAGYRMPTANEWSSVAPCVTGPDLATFGYNHDVAVSVGGCNCKWNNNWCGQPSIETIRGGRMCGDFDQLQICVPTCVRIGWKTGGDTWSCPAGYRMPFANELIAVAPCITQQDNAMFGYYNDIAISVGGCNCKWNNNWCGQPSIETMRGGRMCGDFTQLQICVR